MRDSLFRVHTGLGPRQKFTGPTLMPLVINANHVSAVGSAVLFALVASTYCSHDETVIGSSRAEGVSTFVPLDSVAE